MDTDKTKRKGLRHMKKSNILLIAFAMLAAAASAGAEGISMDFDGKNSEAVKGFQTENIKMVSGAEKSAVTTVAADRAVSAEARLSEAAVQAGLKSGAIGFQAAPGVKALTFAKPVQMVPSKIGVLQAMGTKDKESFLKKLQGSGLTRGSRYTFGDCWTGSEITIGEAICRTVCCTSSPDTMHSPAGGDDKPEISCYDDCSDGTADGEDNNPNHLNNKSGSGK